MIDLIKRTAHTPGEGPNPATGYGVVDPIAALTYQLPPANTTRTDVGIPMVRMLPSCDVAMSM